MGTGMAMAVGLLVLAPLQMNTGSAQTEPFVRGAGAAGQVAYWVGSDLVTSEIAGENALYWDSSANRLGIGTSVPSKTLDVVGNTRTNRISVATAANVGFLPTDHGLIGAHGDGTNTPNFFSQSTNKDIAWKDGEVLQMGEWSGSSFTERLRIETDGSVGIGTTTPGHLLDVSGDTRADSLVVALSTDEGFMPSSPGMIAIHGDSADLPNIYTQASSKDIAWHPSQYLQIGQWDGSTFTERLVINPNGDVKIGACCAASGLHVPDGKYFQAEDQNSGAPPSADCDNNAERGRMSLDISSNNRLYICNGALRGWDWIALND